ncbi:hypothetical protein XI09_42335 [Bradyrhizobium sp. CCBAU 11386]|uniref:hypothetical protein n=1 Tax=Bradyrhizobium sp. CCBAU 11386 TaxID=1630837 RepID=UPI002303B512|nr:hypothetical protein [Bradyrhizobium sp. CCBAU 11386]MDA9511180.1 hypothetical protein [Bradyrhizobium sp. CCBAU 11386]
MICGLAALAYLVAAASLGVWLDNRAGVVASSCISGKPSTCVAAWSWLGLPIVLALGALL